MKILKKSVSAIALSVVAAQVVHAGYNSRDHRVRCQRMQNNFVLNKANVNTLIALSCGSLSHVENERSQMDYQNSATLFHQWTTTGDSTSGIAVKGYCAIPLKSLRSGDFERHKIEMTFKQLEASTSEIKIEAKGVIAGKSMDLKFSNNEFIDTNCHNSNGVMAFNSLRQINLGSGMGLQTLIDLVRSQRTGISLGMLDQEDWTQGKNTGYFSRVGLKYNFNQWNGRRLAIAMVSDSANTLVGRSANILDWAEGGQTFAIKKDSFGHSDGFAYHREPNNHKFQAYSVAGGAQMVGCSALVYESELDTSVDVSLENCKSHIEASALSKYTLRSTGTVEQSAEERQEQIRRYRINLETQRIQAYLTKNYGPAANYSERPGVYEGGKKPWSSADKERGFVILQRNFTLDSEKAVINVVEHRSDANGNRSVKRYTVPMEKI